MNPSCAPRQGEIIQSLRNELKKSNEKNRRLKEEIEFLKSHSCEQVKQKNFQLSVSNDVNNNIHGSKTINNAQRMRSAPSVDSKSTKRFQNDFTNVEPSQKRLKTNNVEFETSIESVDDPQIEHRTSYDKSFGDI